LLAVAAFPLATFAARGLAGVSHAGGGAVALVLAIDALVVAVALRLGRRPAPALGWILGAIVALLVADVATGARLQVASVLGYAPTGAGRFYGIGNGAFGVLGAATVLAAAGHLGRAPRRTDALAAVAALFGLVVVVDGAPTLGADGGGVVTLVPVLAVVLVALARHRVSWRVVAAAALGAVVVIALVVGVDLLRPAADRTHLGRTLAVGFLGGRLAWTMLAHTFAHPIFERSNYRGEPVVTAAGVVLPLVLLVVEGGRALAGAVGTGTRVGLTGGRTLVLLAVLGFGLLGALDDLVGGGDPRGFRGHVAALLRGRLTLGGMKLVGGVAVALVAVAPAAGRSGGRLVADAALVALSANLGNLL